MASARIKKGDVVYVITGSDKGKSGKVLKVFPKKNRVTVEGINVHKKAYRRSQARPNGGIDNIELPIDMSNVMAEERYQARKGAKKGADK